MWGEGGHGGGGEQLRLPATWDGAVELGGGDDAAEPGLHPLEKGFGWVGVVAGVLGVVGGGPCVDPGGGLVGEPEPFAVEVVVGALFEVGDGAAELGVGEGLLEGEGDIVAGERGMARARSSFRGFMIAYVMECTS